VGEGGHHLANTTAEPETGAIKMLARQAWLCMLKLWGNARA
jgi:hypothetical protein